ncbi:MAG: chaperone modulator CbpM [Pseudomonadota bacterium]
MSDADLLEGACLTLEQLCAASALERSWLVERIEAGLVPAEGGSAASWRFSSTVLVRVRRMHDIERAYDAAPELAALVADMLEEMDALRARLRRFGE